MINFELFLRLTTLVVLAAGLYYAVRQLRLIKKTFTDDHDWRRRVNAQEAILSFSDGLEHWKALEESFNYMDAQKGIEIEKIEEEIQKNPSLKATLGSLLNLYEMLAIGIHHRVYDEGLIRDARSRAMIHVYTVFEQYIKKTQEHYPSVWNNMETLVNRWKNEKTEKSHRNKMETLANKCKHEKTYRNKTGETS